MGIDPELAQQFADLSYSMNTDEDRATRVNNINSQIPDEWSVVEEHTDKRQLTLYNASSHHYHTAIRGTDPTNTQDVLQDAAIGLNVVSKNDQFEKRHKKLENAVNSFEDDAEWTMSSHSLGAGQTSYSLAKSKDLTNRVSEVHNFNGAASPFTDSAFGKTTKSQKATLEDKVFHHRNEDDIVSMGLTMAGSNMGTTKTYKSKGKSSTGHLETAILGFSPSDMLSAHSPDVLDREEVEVQKKTTAQKIEKSLLGFNFFT
tara:strand:- start:1546 stop:2322 length:777 start_codon:yes stop_codon:yes gene_type:complete